MYGLFRGFVCGVERDGDLFVIIELSVSNECVVFD